MVATPLDNKLAQVEQRPGHLEIIGETAAKLLLFQQGWNPYSRFLDTDKVDLILRRKRKGIPEYREIQVKYRRLFVGKKDSAWDAKLFSATAWYSTEEDAFADRPGLFIMFIFAYPDRQIEKDVLIFPSGEFHDLIQLAPRHKKAHKTDTSRVLYISKSCEEGRWYVRRTRKKFAAIDTTTDKTANCVDVTHYRNNFAILD
jgi:hypothetical protein